MEILTNSKEKKDGTPLSKDVSNLLPVEELDDLAQQLGWGFSSAGAKAVDLLREWMNKEAEAGRIRLNPPRPLPKARPLTEKERRANKKFEMYTE